MPGGNYADRNLSYYNTYSGNVAAAEAIVNGQNILVIGIKCSAPSRAPESGKIFPGGVSCLDIEPNVGRNHQYFDRAVNIGVFNMDCDYTGGYLTGGAGNCINIQNPGSESDVHDITVANIVVWGGLPSDPTARPLSNGLLITGHVPNLLVSNVVVTKSGQSCLQLDKATGKQTYQNVDCVSCGGGGVSAVTIFASSDATFERLRIFNSPGTAVSTDPRVLNCGTGNVFNDGLVITSEGCAPL